MDLYWSLIGVDLTSMPLVGLGSVCRRQGTDEAGRIIAALHSVGLKDLHGFGFKTLDLQQHGHLLTSADSLVWSIDARYRSKTLPGHLSMHKNCANCLPLALQWLTSVLAAAATHGKEQTR